MTQIDYQAPVKVPLGQRVNLRIIIFAAFMLLVIGYPAYLIIEMQVTGGVKKVAGGFTEVDLKAMSSFQFDQVDGAIEDVPKKWRDLDGKKVILYGEIWAPNAAGDEINDFQLCYSIAKCCYSGTPQVQHFVISKTKPGDAVGYYR